MIVRLGYVAMSTVVKNASPSKTMTVTNFSKLLDREAAIRKLERIGAENLHNTLRLLRHNRAHDIMVYRCSSKLIPLIGHELLSDWNPIPTLSAEFQELGDYAKQNSMRLSFHPDHFTVLSTPRHEVLRNSIADLERHVEMLNTMGLGLEAKCNIHIGGTYGDKAKAAIRFVTQFQTLRPEIQERITLENDDKTFTALETLELAERVGVPMVLDIHHHQVNNNGEDIVELWPRIQKTWTGSENPKLGVAIGAGVGAGTGTGTGTRTGVGVRAGNEMKADAGADSDAGNGTGEANSTNTIASLPPKIHVSSPKSEKDPRSHADYVEVEPLMRFLRSIAHQTAELDIMIEAKMKDEALFRLMVDLGKQEGVKVLTQASVEI